MLEAIRDVWPMAIIPAVIWLCVWNEERKARQRAAIAQELKDNAARKANEEAIRNSSVMAERNDAEWAKAHGNTR